MTRDTPAEVILKSLGISDPREIDLDANGRVVVAVDVHRRIRPHVDQVHDLHTARVDGAGAQWNTTSRSRFDATS